MLKQVMSVEHDSVMSWTRNEDDRGQTDIYLVILFFYTIGKRNAFRPLSSAPLSQSRQGALAIVELRTRRNHIKDFRGIYRDGTRLSSWSCFSV